MSDLPEELRKFAAQYGYSYDINDPELLRRYRFYKDGERDVAARLPPVLVVSPNLSPHTSSNIYNPSIDRVGK